MEIPGELIPLAGIVFGLSIPILRSVLDYGKRRRLMELHHTERMAAIERGMELPPLPVDVIGVIPPKRPRSSLLPGLVWLFIGVAIILMHGELGIDDHESSLRGWGLIPAGIGLAYLIYYVVEGRKLEREARAQAEVRHEK